MKVTIFCLVLFVGIVSSQSADEIPPELKCFLKGFFKCRKNLRSVCSEFEGNNRRPVPIPKRRFEGNCPILGQTIPKVDLATISLPDCPCVDGNSVRFHYFLNLLHLNLHETDLLFRYLSHHLTWHCLLILPVHVCCDHKIVLH